MNEIKRKIDPDRLKISKEKNIESVMNQIESYPVRAKRNPRLKYYFGILAVLVVAFFTFYDFPGSINPSTESYDFLAIDINPSIEFVLSEEGFVMSVQYNNTDAEITASDLDFIGLHYEEAVNLFIEAAIYAGYIDVNTTDNNVVITYGSENQETESKAQKEVEDIAQRFLEQNRVGAAVLAGEQVFEELNQLATQFDISVGKARMIQSVLEDDSTLNIEGLVQMSMIELSELISGIHEHNMNQFKETRLEESLETKSRLMQQNQATVEEFKVRVQNGSQEVPDYDSIKEDHLRNYQNKSEEFQSKSDALKQGAQHGGSSNNPQGGQDDGGTNSPNHSDDSGSNKPQKNGVFSFFVGRIQF